MTSNVLAGGMDTQRLPASDAEQERRQRVDTGAALYMHRAGHADLLDMLGIDGPRRVQLRRTAGWRKPDNTRVVARNTRYGNPYAVGQASIPDRAAAVAAFERMLARHAIGLHDGLPDYPDLSTLRRDLAGRNLGCWCTPPAPGQVDVCHATVLIVWVNRESR